MSDCCVPRLAAAGKIHALFNADNDTDLLYTLSHHPAGALGDSFFENLAGERACWGQVVGHAGVYVCRAVGWRECVSQEGKDVLQLHKAPATARAELPGP